MDTQALRSIVTVAPNDERLDVLREAALAKAVAGYDLPDEYAEQLREQLLDDVDQFGERSDAEATCIVDAIVRDAASFAEARKQDFPEITDCERLDSVQASLLERNIVFWQNSPCCNTCSWAESEEHVRYLESMTGRQVEGICFYHDQETDRVAINAIDGERGTMHLSYGSTLDHSNGEPPDSPDFVYDNDAYQAASIAVGKIVVEELRREGFEVDWNGTIEKTICFSVFWQKR